MRVLALACTLACAPSLLRAEDAAPAGDAPAGSAATSNGPGQLQSITVTANKRREDIKDVPTSISAVDGGELAEHHVVDYGDITRTVPGVSFQAGAGPGLSNIEIRGVSSTSGSATVGIYLDEVSITVKNTYDGAVQPKLFDIDRVEVLRGPQGTLFGASSMGGTIRFIQNQPDLMRDTTTIATDVSSTTHGGINHDTSLIANFAIVPGTFALRVGADFAHNSGYIDHYAGTVTGIPPGGNATNGNLLTLNTNDSTGQLVQSGVNTQGTDVFRVVGKYLGPEGLTITPSLLFQRTTTGDSGIFYPGIGLYDQDKRVTEPSRDLLTVPSLTITKAFDFAELTSVSSNFRRDFRRVSDGTYYNSNVFGLLLGATNTPATAAAFGLPLNPLPPALQGQASQIGYLTQGIIGFLPSPVYNDTITDQFSQELRLTSKDATFAGLPITWVGGIYYSHMKQTHSEVDPIIGLNSAYSALYPGLPIDQSALGAVNLPGVSYANDIIYQAHTSETEQQVAPFGELGVSLTPALKAAFGLRYVKASQSYGATSGGYFAYGLPSPYSDSEHFSATTPKVSLDYAIDGSHNVYTSAAKGFRLGGPTGPDPANIPGGSCDPDYANLGIPGAPLKYDSDSLWSYEVGSKGRYLDNTLSVNAALYAINWSNIQQTINLPTCGFGFTTNAGDARSLGTEIEVRALVTEALTLGLAAGTTHAYITRTSESGVFKVGESILNVPEYTATFSADYDAPINDTLFGFVRADYAYTGKSHAYFNSSTVTQHDSPEYGVMNFNIGVSSKEMSFGLYARNLFDNKRIIQYPSVNTVQEGFTLQPLTVGVTASFKM